MSFASQVKSETGPWYTESRERPKREADHSRGWVVGLLSKGICIHLKIVLGSHTMRRSPHCPARILKVPVEAFMGFSHVFSPGGLNDSLPSQGSVIGTPSSVGKTSKMLAPRTRGGVRLPGSSWRVTRVCVFFMTSSNTNLPQWQHVAKTVAWYHTQVIGICTVKI